MADMKTALQTYRIAHLRCRLSRGIIETHISEGAPSA